jgi:hypothetical protein
MTLAAEIRKCIRDKYSLQGFTSNDIAKHFPGTKIASISSVLLDLNRRKIITYTNKRIVRSKVYVYSHNTQTKNAQEEPVPGLIKPDEESSQDVNPASVGRAIMAYIEDLKKAEISEFDQKLYERMTRYKERIESLVLELNSVKKQLEEAKRMNETKDKALGLKQDKIDQLEAKLEHSGCIVQTTKPFTLGEVARIKQFIKR